MASGFLTRIFLTTAVALLLAAGPAEEHSAERDPFRVMIRNIHGGTLPAGSLPRVILTAGAFVAEAAAPEGMAVFDNLPRQRFWNMQVEVQSPSRAYQNPLEYWGSMPVSTRRASQPAVFTRQMPYISGVKTFDGERFGHYVARENGIPLIIKVLVNNPSKHDLNLSVKLSLMNQTTDSLWVLEQTTVSRAGESKEVLFSFTPSCPGFYVHAPAVQLMNDTKMFTDCWDWSAQPIFSVVDQHRKIDFGGYSWYVKSGFGNPGPNRWSDNPQHVWINDSGELTLTLTPNGQNWLATEVISEDHFGYGTYTFYLKSNPELYNPFMVAALFLYRNSHNEIDIEFTRWGDPDNPHAGNYVMQPSDIPGNHYTFPLNLMGNHSTHQITWQKDKVKFQSWHGHYPQPQTGQMIASWEYTGQNIPGENNIRLHMNFWLFQGHQPQEGSQQEFIITRFSYSPDSKLEPVISSEN